MHTLQYSILIHCAWLVYSMIELREERAGSHATLTIIGLLHLWWTLVWGKMALDLCLWMNTLKFTLLAQVPHKGRKGDQKEQWLINPLPLLFFNYSLCWSNKGGIASHVLRVPQKKAPVFSSAFVSCSQLLLQGWTTAIMPHAAKDVLIMCKWTFPHCTVLYIIRLL